MRWGVYACLALLVAGCAAPEDPTPVEDAPTAPDESLPIDAMVSPGGPGGCNVQGCWVAATPELVFRTPMDAELHGLDLDVGVLNGADRVQWELTCITLEDRSEPRPDSPCRMPLAQGEGGLPSKVSATGIALPPRTAILLKLTYPSLEPAVDAMYSVVTGQSHVTGQAIVARLPPASVPQIVLVPEAYETDQTSGPCILLVEECAVVGGGDLWDERFEGNVYALNLTMTWDSGSPADAELGLRVGGRGPGRGPDLVVVGPSPLVLEASALEFGEQVFFIVYRPQAADLIEGPGIRTPVHVEGTVWVEPWPAEE